MNRLPTIASALTAAGLTVVLVGVAVNGFTDAERKVIRQMKQRMTNIEARHAADVAGLAADIQVLMENQRGQANDIDILDAGLSGVVATDGPIGQVDRNLAALQTYVWDRVPVVALTDITPVVTCNGTTCTVDVEWSSAPPATGQVEWGVSPEYGNLTGLEDEALGFHRQRLGTFPEDGATYHFRVLATIPDGEAASADMSIAAG